MLSIEGFMKCDQVPKGRVTQQEHRHLALHIFTWCTQLQLAQTVTYSHFKDPYESLFICGEFEQYCIIPYEKNNHLINATDDAN